MISGGEKVRFKRKFKSSKTVRWTYVKAKRIPYIEGIILQWYVFVLKLYIVMFRLFFCNSLQSYCLKLTIALFFFFFFFFLFLSLDIVSLITYSYYGRPALMSDCFFGSPPIHYRVLYDNIVFVFLANKYSLSLPIFRRGYTESSIGKRRSRKGRNSKKVAVSRS